ncbi:MAG TPA: hypothetical protein VGD66_13735 [Allosphingosinicella sp.]|jgi:hypothetical protein
MDEDRRARLAEKRRLAQLRRARATASAAFRGVAPALRAAGVKCSKLVPARCREALGPLTGGPGEDERLLWAPIPNGTCARWTSAADRDALLREALARCAAPDAKVAVVWHPYEAGLALRAADLAAQASPILDAGHGGTIWIVAAQGGPWLIEAAFWDRELCWTPAMPLFAGRG